MVDQNLIATLSLEDNEALDMLAAEFGQAVADGDMEGLIEHAIGDFKPGSILTGKIIGMAGDDFLVDIDLKSEGILDKTEFDNPADVELAFASKLGGGDG